MFTLINDFEYKIRVNYGVYEKNNRLDNHSIKHHEGSISKKYLI